MGARGPSHMAPDSNRQEITHLATIKRTMAAVSGQGAASTEPVTVNVYGPGTGGAK